TTTPSAPSASPRSTPPWWADPSQVVGDVRVAAELLEEGLDGRALVLLLELRLDLGADLLERGQLALGPPLLGGGAVELARVLLRGRALPRLVGEELLERRLLPDLRGGLLPAQPLLLEGGEELVGRAQPARGGDLLGGGVDLLLGGS